MTAFELIEDPVLISLLKEHVSISVPARFDKVINSSNYPPNLYRVILETKNPRKEIIWVKHNGRVVR